jgi:hypothetical protein
MGRYGLVIGGRRDQLVRIGGAAIGGLLVVALGAWGLSRVGAADDGSLSDEDPAAVVTAPVERRVLESIQPTRGTIFSPAQATVIAPAAAEGQFAVVATGLPLPKGAQVTAGAVVAELNGRPTIVLPGAIPFFRDIRPGDTGPDVEAVQGALQAMGHGIPTAEQGEFGIRTRSAVEKLYTEAGYEPLYTVGDKDAWSAAVGEANEAVSEAEHRLAEEQASGVSDLGALESALATAQESRRKFRETEGLLLVAREFVAVPVLPAVLVDLPVSDGQQLEAGAPVASIGSSQFQLRIDLTSAQVSDLSPQMTITANSDDGYQAICPPGKATKAQAPHEPAGGETDQTGQDEGGGGGGPTDAWEMIVICDPLPPPEALGSNIRVVMTVHRSDGPVLVVPTTAITTRPNGDAFVEVVEQNGDTRRVAVTVGGEAEGFAAVSPEEGALEEGMQVRVRRR